MTLLSENVLVLNKYLMAITVTTVRDAVIALYTGKASVIDTNYTTFNFEDWEIQSLKLEKASCLLVNPLMCFTTVPSIQFPSLLNTSITLLIPSLPLTSVKS